eukprot:PhF_6_TR43393/c0_g1_i1/m.66618/K00649/GNPAT; glyceronephosphate O-acyltransferase
MSTCLLVHQHTHSDLAITITRLAPIYGFQNVFDFATIIAVSPLRCFNEAVVVIVVGDPPRSFQENIGSLCNPKESILISIESSTVDASAFSKSFHIRRETYSINLKILQDYVGLYGIERDSVQAPSHLDVVSDELLVHTSLNAFLWWQSERKIISSLSMRISVATTNPLQWARFRQYCDEYFNSPLIPGEIKFHLKNTSRRDMIAEKLRLKLPRKKPLAEIPEPIQQMVQRGRKSRSIIESLAKKRPTSPFCDEYLRYLHSPTFYNNCEKHPGSDPFGIDWEIVIKSLCYETLKQIRNECCATVPVQHIPQPLKHFSEDELFTGTEKRTRQVPLVNHLLWVRTKGFKPNGSKVPMRQGCTPAARKRILDSKQVQNAIESVSKDQSLPKANIEARAHDILTQMGDNMNERHVKFFAAIMRGVFLQMYSRVHINPEAWGMLKDHFYSHKGSRIGVVLVPSHRSYIDFLIVSYVLLCMDVPIPHICAGEDFLRLGLVASILRGSGGFFMRRSFKGDALYTALFSEYLKNLLYSNECIEFFVEGTRSRTQKTLPPKVGILKFLTEAYTSQDFAHPQVDDVVFIPVSLSYDRVLEENLYVTELLGAPKPKETIKNLWNSLGFLRNTYGSVHVNFGDPISLKSQPQSSVGTIAKNLVLSLEKGCIVTPTALLSTVLLRRHTQEELMNGVPRSVVVDGMEWIRGFVLRNHGKMMSTWDALSGEKIFEYAMTMLPNTLQMTSMNAVRLEVNPSTLVHLQLYENQLLGLFIHRAAHVCCARSGGLLTFPTLVNLLSQEFPVLECESSAFIEGENAPQCPIAQAYLFDIVELYIELYWAAATLQGLAVETKVNLSEATLHHAIQSMSNGSIPGLLAYKNSVMISDQIRTAVRRCSQVIRDTKDSGVIHALNACRRTRLTDEER